MNKTPVMLGVPTNKWQHPSFWMSLMGLAGTIAGVIEGGGALTDMSRNNIAAGFLESKADWLMFVDDDVAVPPDALQVLLETHKPFVAGVYYLRNAPYNPLIYKRNENGWYEALLPARDYTPGDLLRIDACGLGCALLHRSVFEQILETHTLFRRMNGSYGFLSSDSLYEVDTPLPVENILGEDYQGEPQLLRRESLVVHDGNLYKVEQVNYAKPELLNEKERLPFFAFEYGRTEDYYFCELARHAGVPIYAATGLECMHYGPTGIGRQHFNLFRAIEVKT